MRACKNVPYFDDILFLHVSQSNSWLFSLVLNGLTDWFRTASSNGLSVMLISYILEIIKQGPFGRILPRQGMHQLCPAFSSPPLCHIRCMIVNDVSQWGWVTVSPFHINSHRFKLIAHGLFSVSGFPSCAHVPFNQDFPCSHISCLVDCSRSTACFPTHGVSPSRLHFMLWFFKWSLVLGTGDALQCALNLHKWKSSLKERRLLLTWCCFWAKHYDFWPVGCFLLHLRELKCERSGVGWVAVSGDSFARSPVLKKAKWNPLFSVKYFLFQIGLCSSHVAPVTQCVYNYMWRKTTHNCILEGKCLKLPSLLFWRGDLSSVGPIGMKWQSHTGALAPKEWNVLIHVRVQVSGTVGLPGIRQH